jgi:low affinity Fe/Cu permease
VNLPSFATMARALSIAAGSRAAFLTAIIVVVVWAFLGPVFAYSDTWQLVINTGTSVATFLMVFLIQNTQNRDSAATLLKLDELIRVNAQASNALIGLEERAEAEVGELKARIASEAPP